MSTIYVKDTMFSKSEVLEILNPSTFIHPHYHHLTLSKNAGFTYSWGTAGDYISKYVLTPLVYVGMVINAINAASHTDDEKRKDAQIATAKTIGNIAGQEINRYIDSLDKNDLDKDFYSGREIVKLINDYKSFWFKCQKSEKVKFDFIQGKFEDASVPGVEDAGYIFGPYAVLVEADTIFDSVIA